MHLLPEIVALILCRATDSADACSLANWKLQLPLLAICRQWRLVGLPLVYRQLFIECKEQDIETNFSLLSSIPHLHHLARSLKISMSPQTHLLPFLQAAIDSLTQVSMGVPLVSVASLTIDLCSGGPYSFTSVVDTGNADHSDLQLLASKVAYLLPNVSSLHCAPSQNIDSCAAFTAALSDHYAQNARRLKSYVYSPLKALELAQLATLDLFFFSSTSQTLPKINVERLYRMSLVNVSGEFSWSSFYPVQTTESSSNVVFESLCRLHLFFHSHVNVFKQNTKVRLSFPNLRFLCTDKSPSTATLLSMAHFPSVLEEFRVFCPEGAVISMPDVDFTLETRQKIASHMAKVEGMWDFIRLTNCLFTLSKGTLTMGGQMFLPKPSVISWPYLSVLSIAPPICPFALVQYIAALPNLAQLQVASLELDSIVLTSTEPLQDIEDSEHTRLWPPRLLQRNDYKLESLVVNFDCKDEQVHGKAASVIQYLLVNLPRLSSLSIPDPLVSCTRAFISSHIIEYPFLSNICI
ncbi:hypothetical protein BX070DRAFT_252103 [Coemansia spiralis]|nr:hypothetical protein BX070DRAFT_252103 [Coemansia spiralis]